MTAIAESAHAGHDDAHGHHENPLGHLAHHFESHEQQFDSGKLGMWLFLVTEVLFFSGLFCAYAIYRSLHPEVFQFADQYLDKTLGAFNTGVLLLSSLTMAWAVRCAQLEQKKGLATCLIITLACASLFLGVKAVEYTHKWDLGLYWAGWFEPAEHEAAHGAFHLSPTLMWMSSPFVAATIGLAVAALVAWRMQKKVLAPFLGALALTAAAYFIGVGCGMGIPAIQQAIVGHEAHDHHDAHGEESAFVTAAGEDPKSPEAKAEMRRNLGVFFSIYYCMTGLHAIHIFAGMGAIAWILFRSLAGNFTAFYFGPVDYVGLYWHLVDLIWIYLFPLLYLIH